MFYLIDPYAVSRRQKELKDIRDSGRFVSVTPMYEILGFLNRSQIKKEMLARGCPDWVANVVIQVSALITG